MGSSQNGHQAWPVGEVQSQIMTQHCYLARWLTMDYPGRTFEPGFGKPFGTGQYEYVMLETHYNNPERLEGEKGAASYTFLWTNEEVDTEVGTLTLGDLQVEGWFLEPGKPLVKHATVCT